MSRRKPELFNLSFLDLLTSALGAVIFLFIITPKGGAPAAKVQQAAVYIDTAQMQVFGALHDSLRHKRVGDTLFAVLVDYRNMPKEEKPQAYVPPTRQQVPEQIKTPQERSSRPEPKKEAPPKNDNANNVKKPEPEKNKAPSDSPQPAPEPRTYRGDAPSVPCNVSFEVSWRSAEDNIDLFVCKGGDCVYGGRKKDNNIGQWDSGKSRNRLFGNDLRTNQEAVRQFDKIVPGEYKLYAQFKESDKNRTKVIVNGLIYTKDEQNREQGDSFTASLTLGSPRVLLGTVVLQENGNFKLIKP
ncbi:MAG: hypothetical protein KDD19_10470 [Phaeodactylibacter sp.]|nr:hypothetical protein [Phaeodactylibacter sp.]MCB9050175.1 hypothetical protein [Lewinellaceae bacterium]